MRTSKNAQREARRHLDEKFASTSPSHELLEELATKCTSDPNPDNTFQYAFALSKSLQPSELKYSISMLNSLIKDGYQHQVDCMYGTATAHYLLGEYDVARLECEAILRSRPEHDAAAELHTACVAARDAKEEKMVGQIALGGTVAVAAIGLAFLLGGKKR